MQRKNRNMKTEKFQITGMSCAACQIHVAKSVQKLDGVSDVDVSLLANTMVVKYDDLKTDSQKIAEAVSKAGYGAFLFEHHGGRNDFRREWQRRKEEEVLNQKKLKQRLILSIIFLIPLLYISMGHMLLLPVPLFLSGKENSLLFAFTQFLLTIPVVVINGHFFVSGIKAFFNKMPNMDSLVAIGAGASLLYGIFAIYMMIYGFSHGNFDFVLRYSKVLYFESCATILTLVTVGKYLEARSKAKTSDALDKLVNLAPKTAVIIRNGKEVIIPSEQVVSGDIVLIKPGESIPVDGVVTDGYGYVDQSAITGESIPVEKNIGDEVLSATVNKNGSFRFRASNVGEDTTLARIIKLVDEAGSSKAPIARLADSISGIFVPAVIVIAILTAICWIAAGQSFEFAFNCAVSVLVISCPCALGLATPVAIMVGMGKAAEYGILIKSAESLERLHSVDTVVLDKTGTVTSGRPKVTDVEVFANLSEKDFLSIAASIEQGSEHPLAGAVVNKAKEEGIEIKTPDKFEIIPGKGVLAVIDGESYTAGNIKLMSENEVEDSAFFGKMSEKYSYLGKTPLFFAKNKKLLGLIAVADSVRQTSADAVMYLKQSGLRVILLTGDNRLTAGSIAKEVGIDEVIADVRPEGKEAEVGRLQDSGHRVAMVGDGVNDAPALVRADVGIAIGAGTDIAVDSGDVVLMKDSLLDVVRAIRLSGEVVKNIRTSLFWAFVYNIIGIPVAAGVLYPAFGLLLSPMIAAAAMSLSSVCVVSNALRIRLFRDNIEEQPKEKELFAGDKNMKKIMLIDGMMCAHCQKRVHDVLSALDGVAEVDVNLENKTAVVVCSKEIDDKILTDAVTNAGYEVLSIKAD